MRLNLTLRLVNLKLNRGVHAAIEVREDEEVYMMVRLTA